MGRRKDKGRSHAQIERLFLLAGGAERPDLAQRYVLLARKLATSHRISLRGYNRVHCRKCGAYWTSKTLRVRTRPQSVVYECLSCGAIKRFKKN